MLKKYYSVFGPALRFLDALILVASWLVAYYLRKHFPLSIMHTTLPKFSEYRAYSIVIVLLWGTIFSISKLYSSKRMVRRTAEAYRVLRAHSLGLLIFVAMTYLVSSYKLSRGVFLYFGIISGFFLVAYRLALRNTLRHLRAKGYNLQHVVIVGTGAAAFQVFQKLNRHPELGLNIIGFVGSSPAKNLQGLPVLGTVQETAQVIQKHSANKIVFALSRDEIGLMEDALASIKDEFVDILFVPDVYDYIALGCEVEDFDGLPVVNLNDYPLNGWGAYTKRFLDILASGIALSILSPLLLLIAAAIKLTSRGPVYYTQERMGLDGRTFHMLKFRSMHVDAELQSGAVWAKPNDTRRTPIGSFLRSTSLDELPQFWNVLKGDMSLVGPRPERPVFVQEFRQHIPHYMLRHKVKAGITGWAQVNGWRGNTSLDKRIEFDLYYIKNWSMIFDMKIILLTLVKGFVNRNAY